MFDSADEYFAAFATVSASEQPGVRERGAAVAAAGPEAVAARPRPGWLRWIRLPAERPDRRTVVAGGAMRLDDYLVTRIVEQVVHLDDLARSLGVDEVRRRTCTLPRPAPAACEPAAATRRSCRAATWRRRARACAHGGRRLGTMTSARAGRRRGAASPAVMRVGSRARRPRRPPRAQRPGQQPRARGALGPLVRAAQGDVRLPPPRRPRHTRGPRGLRPRQRGDDPAPRPGRRHRPADPPVPPADLPQRPPRRHAARDGRRPARRAQRGPGGRHPPRGRGGVGRARHRGAPAVRAVHEPRVR